MAQPALTSRKPSRDLKFSRFIKSLLVKTEYSI